MLTSSHFYSQLEIPFFGVNLQKMLVERHPSHKQFGWGHNKKKLFCRKEVWTYLKTLSKSPIKTLIQWIKYVLFRRTYICEVPAVVEFTETRSRILRARSWGVGTGELPFHGDRVSFLQDEKSSGDGWWWWLPNNAISSVSLNCTTVRVKMGKTVHLMLCIFCHNLQKKRVFVTFAMKKWERQFTDKMEHKLITSRIQENCCKLSNK